LRATAKGSRAAAPYTAKRFLQKKEPHDGRQGRKKGQGQGTEAEGKQERAGSEKKEGQAAEAPVREVMIRAASMQRVAAHFFQIFWPYSII
jgi:hypothetical protein